MYGHSGFEYNFELKWYRLLLGGINQFVQTNGLLERDFRSRRLGDVENVRRQENFFM